MNGQPPSARELYLRYGDQRLSESGSAVARVGPSGNQTLARGPGAIIIARSGQSWGDAGDDSLRWKSVINKDSQIPIGGNHPLQ